MAQPQQRTKRTERDLPADAPLVEERTGKILCINEKGHRRYMGELELMQNRKWQRVTGKGKAVAKKAAPKEETPAVDGAVAESGPGSAEGLVGTDDGDGEEGGEGEGNDTGNAGAGRQLKSLPEVIAAIKEAKTAKEVDEIVAGDDRSQVTKAATKRKGELKK